MRCMSMGNAYDYSVLLNINKYNERVVRERILSEIKKYLEGSVDGEEKKGSKRALGRDQ